MVREIRLRDASDIGRLVLEADDVIDGFAEFLVAEIAVDEIPERDVGRVFLDELRVLWLQSRVRLVSQQFRYRDVHHLGELWDELNVRGADAFDPPRHGSGGYVEDLAELCFRHPGLLKIF